MMIDWYFVLPYELNEPVIIQCDWKRNFAFLVTINIIYVKFRFKYLFIKYNFAPFETNYEKPFNLFNNSTMQLSDQYIFQL